MIVNGLGMDVNIPRFAGVFEQKLRGIHSAVGFIREIKCAVLPNGNLQKLVFHNAGGFFHAVITAVGNALFIRSVLKGELYPAVSGHFGQPGKHIEHPTPAPGGMTAARIIAHIAHKLFFQNFNGNGAAIGRFQRKEAFGKPGGHIEPAFFHAARGIRGEVEHKHRRRAVRAAHNIAQSLFFLLLAERHTRAVTRHDLLEHLIHRAAAEAVVRVIFQNVFPRAVERPRGIFFAEQRGERRHRLEAIREMMLR